MRKGNFLQENPPTPTGHRREGSLKTMKRRSEASMGSMKRSFIWGESEGGRGWGGFPTPAQTSAPQRRSTGIQDPWLPCGLKSRLGAPLGRPRADSG